MSYLGYKNPAFIKRVKEKRKAEELKTQQGGKRNELLRIQKNNTKKISA